MARQFAPKRILASFWALVLALTLVFVTVPAPHLSAMALAQRSVRVNNALAAQSNVIYRASFTTLATSLIGSVRIQFCSNTPLVDEPCTAPSGFDISNALMASENGITGFVISPSTTANDMILTRPPASETPVSANYQFTGVTNPASGGTMFARMYTYPTSDGSGPYTDSGGVALHFEGGLGVSAEVPPYLRFCLGESITNFDCTTATEPFSDVGVLDPLVTGSAQTQMVVATNASTGYSLWVQGGTMTSGNNTIPAMSGAASQKGTSQFGINLRANTTPVIGQNPTGPGLATIAPGYNQQNQFRFHSGDILASATQPDDNLKITVSYIVNVNANQPGGIYATTLTYITLANF